MFDKTPANFCGGFFMYSRVNASAVKTVRRMKACSGNEAAMNCSVKGASLDADG